MPKTRNSAPPAKGTKSRQLLLLMLRKQGVTSDEIREQLGWSHSVISHVLQRLHSDCGYDVRSFKLDVHYCYKLGEKGSARAYRLVGKSLWDGRYRSFVNPQ